MYIISCTCRRCRTRFKGNFTVQIETWETQLSCFFSYSLISLKFRRVHRDFETVMLHNNSCCNDQNLVIGITSELFQLDLFIFYIFLRQHVMCDLI